MSKEKLDATDDAAVGDPVPETPPARPDYDRLVEDWWRRWFPNSPVSRQTEAWNHAVRAKDDLKRRLTNV